MPRKRRTVVESEISSTTWPMAKKTFNSTLFPRNRNSKSFHFRGIPIRMSLIFYFCRVIPTEFPSLDLTLNDYTFDGDATSRDSVQQADPGETSFQDVTTSFNDLNQVSSSAEVPAFLSWWNSLRGKILFSHSLASTTVTKTVAIAGEAEIKCLPLGWVVCYWTLI